MPPEQGGPRTLLLAFDTDGDLVRRQPLLTRLIDDGYRLTVAVRHGHEGILPFLEPRADVLTTEIDPDLPDNEKTWARFEDLRRALVSIDPEIVISAPFERTALDDVLLPCFPAARRYGFRDSHAAPETGASTLLTHAVAAVEESQDVEKNRALYEAVSGSAGPLDPPRIVLTEEARREASHVLDAHGLAPGGFVLGCPAGTEVTPLKEWPTDDYLALVRHLHDTHALPVLLTGFAGDESMLRGMASAAQANGIRAPVWIATPGALGLLLGLIASSRFYLGSDSDPLHFAAALGIPVVARLGGGDWPRALPAAARGLVATQQLACFGCRWDCWLDEPACIRAASSETIRDGMDRLLRGEDTGLRVEKGIALDELGDRLVREGSLRHRRLASDERVLQSVAEAESRSLRSTLEANRWLLYASERDRAVRLNQIEGLLAQVRAQEEAIEAMARHSREQGEVIETLNRQARAQEETLQILVRTAEDLHSKVEYLSGSAGALRVLTGAGLRRVGLYDAVRRHRRMLQRLIPLPGPPASQPKAATSSPEAAAPEPRPPILEAFLFARFLAGDTTELALERLYHLGARLENVLCVHASARNIQAAYMLASGGARVTLLGKAGVLQGTPIPGLTVASQDLGEWLLSRSGVLSPFDGVLLDADGPDDDVRLLRGRLSRECTLLVNGAPPGATAAASGETEGVDGLAVASPAPAEWQDPAGGDPEYYAQKPWLPGPRRTVAPPKALPSGRPWPRISVVTATLNQGPFLEETLRSVLGQDYPHLEYIVVDGESADETPAILDRYRHRLAHCLSGPDEGQADALNKGFALATGDILAWLNSDDRYPAGALWRAALAFDAYETDMIVGGCALVRGKADECVSVHHPALPVGRVVSLPVGRLLDIDGSWTKGDFFYQPEVFWTRDIWQRAGGQVAKDLYYSMDYELWLRMAASGARIVRLPDTLAVYRMHEGQKTTGAELPYVPELKQVVARYRATHPAP